MYEIRIIIILIFAKAVFVIFITNTAFLYIHFKNVIICCRLGATFRTHGIYPAYFFPLFVSSERETAPPPPHPITESHLSTPEQQVVLSVNSRVLPIQYPRTLEQYYILLLLFILFLIVPRLFYVITYNCMTNG